jgi:hypothetical protein
MTGSTASRAWLVLVARRVILDVRASTAAELTERLAVLDELGAHAPDLLADLLVAVARYVPDEVVARILLADRDTTTPADELIYRQAHTEHAHGNRAPWVAWGERGYQHLSYLLRRDRRSA